MKQFDNIITLGLTGKFGPLVFRSLNGKTVVSVYRPSSQPSSGNQVAHRQRFKAAAAYAKSAIADNSTRQLYEEKAKKARDGRTPYNFAVADYFTSPHIGRIQLQGNTILVPAYDDGLVSGVTLQLFTRDHLLVEEGPAAALRDGLHWCYEIVSLAASVERIIVTATDLPGNVVRREFDV